jgi:hypothetical protein
MLNTTVLGDSGQGAVSGCCEHGNEPSGDFKDGESVDLLSEC